MPKPKGPEFLRFCIPIVEVLRELGGSGRPAEVTDLVIERMNISETEQEVTNKNGGSRIRNQVAWARFYMVKAGLLSSSQHGVWGLTEKGRNSAMDNDFVLEVFRDVQQKFIAERKSRKLTEPKITEYGRERTELVKQNGRWLISSRVVLTEGGMPESLLASYPKK